MFNEPGINVVGRHYRFELSSEPELVSIADLPQAWKDRISISCLDSERGGYREDRDHRDDGVQSPIHPTPVDPADPVRVEGEWTAEKVINQTVPTGRGQHDLRNMDFACGVRFNLAISDPEQAMPLFDQWFERAKMHLSDPDWDAAWFKFLRAHECATVPLGAKNLADAALESARSKPLPRAANKFRGERVRLLVGLCRELSRLMQGRSFKLSCHQLARLFNVKPPQAWEWLRGLERSGVLRCVDRGRGGYAGHHAATFDYLGD